MSSFVKTFLFALSCFLLQSEVSKSQQWLWADHIGGIEYDGATGTTDTNGNFYIAGTFMGSSCNFLSLTLSAHGNNGLFLAKYDNAGSESWVKQFDINPFPSNCYDGVGDIIVDDMGCVYITGTFYSSAQFGSYILTANNGDMFLAKFSPSGSCMWAKKAGSPAQDWGTGLAVDSIYNVYVCGKNPETAFFDSISVNPGGFMAKYDSTGQIKWAKQSISFSTLYGTPDVNLTCMKVVNNNLLACGWECNTTFIIDTMTVNHPGQYGHILCCYDLSGSIKWVREGLSPAAYSGVNLTTDKPGNIFITGEFMDSINFDGTTLFVSGTNHDYFITKYDKSGGLIWSHSIHGGLPDFIGSIASDTIGNFYVSGGFTGIGNFGPDTLISESSRDMFLARYSPEGNCYGATHFGNAEGLEVGLDNVSRPIVVGLFSGTIQIGYNTLTSYGNEDIFITKSDEIRGIGETKKTASNQLLIYANPNEGKCTVKFPDEFLNEKHLNLSIYDSQGKLIQSVPVDNVEGKVSLNIQAEAKGIYNVILTNGRKNYSGKIVFN